MRGFFLAALFLFLNGCATFSTVFGAESELDTANKNIAAYVLQIDTFTALTIDLLESDVITISQAELAHKFLQKALDAANEAKAVILQTGDPLQAENKIDLIRVLIGGAIAALNNITQPMEVLNEYNSGTFGLYPFYNARA